jgi:2-methylcitrate dehydratase PrpD
MDEAEARIVTDGLGENWEVLNSHYKIYAQDGFIQPITEALSLLREQQAFSIRDIESVTIGTNRLAKDEVIGPIREPKSLTDAQFSANFSAALFLVKGGADFADYSETNLHDPEILELSKRIAIEVDEEIDGRYRDAGTRGARVSVALRDSRILQAAVPDLRLLGEEELDHKFLRLAGTALDAERCEAVRVKVRRLEDVRDVSELATMSVR